MIILKQKNINNILNGANFLSTGGGGTLANAVRLIAKINTYTKVVNYNELRSSDIACTVYGIGGKQKCDPVTATKSALDLFKKIIPGKISALIPVEVGPVSIATCIYLANKLNIPLVDSDIVGLRSSPEIYLETLTLTNLNRTPCAVSDDKGNSMLIYNTENEIFLERILREFAVNCGGLAFVIGYPIKVNKLIKITAGNSITLCENIGEDLRLLKARNITLNNFYKKYKLKYIDSGIITKNLMSSKNGFEYGKYLIKSDKFNYTVYYKNENIILNKENETILTVPDSIIIFDLKNFNGINNFNNNKNKKVAILGKKAIRIWRTAKGKKLFHPKNLGLNYSQILL